VALFFKGMIPWNKKNQIQKTCFVCQKHFSVKQSLSRIKYCSHSCAAKMTKNRTGVPTSPETKLKQRIAKLGFRGEKHWNWCGGKRTERKKDMARDEYIQWRKSVFIRDNFSCQECGKGGGLYLHADHIKPYAYFPELRYNLSNGRTLCVECHRKTDTWGARSKKLYGVKNVQHVQ